MQLSDLMFLIDKIQSGAICVLPTDTVYGLVAATEQPEIVERIYEMKGRSSDKPFIILISELSQLETLSISITDDQAAVLSNIWPDTVSVILPCEDEAFRYLHRGRNSLAFRIPKQVWLRELIHKTGPLIATSANKSGMPITTNLNQIMKQLPDADFYIEGPVSTTPSKLARLNANGSLEWIERTST